MKRWTAVAVVGVLVAATGTLALVKPDTSTSIEVGASSDATDTDAVVSSPPESARCAVLKADAVERDLLVESGHAEIRNAAAADPDAIAQVAVAFQRPVGLHEAVDFVGATAGRSTFVAAYHGYRGDQTLYASFRPEAGEALEAFAARWRILLAQDIVGEIEAEKSLPQTRPEFADHMRRTVADINSGQLPIAGIVAEAGLQAIASKLDDPALYSARLRQEEPFLPLDKASHAAVAEACGEEK